MEKPSQSLLFFYNNFCHSLPCVLSDLYYSFTLIILTEFCNIIMH
jgi:hypothetical protein